MTNKIPQTEWDLYTHLSVWIRITQWFYSAVSFVQGSLFKIKTKVSWIMDDGKVDFWKPSPKVNYRSENFKGLIEEHHKIIINND